MTNLFGTSGIRGILGRDYTFFDVLKIVHSIAKHFDYSPIVIGWDCRIHSKPMALASAAFLQVYGIDVSIAGVISTPSLQKFLREEGDRPGIMFTASHNPPEYFGIKVFNKDGVEIYGESERDITRIYQNLELPEVDWGLSKNRFNDITEDIITTYIDSIDEYSELTKLDTDNIIVGVDYANCAAISTAGRYLTSKGFKLINVNNNLDGRFPGRMPEPNMETLKNTLSILKNKIDIGVAFDGDADRGLIFDGEGNIYWGDHIGALTALYLQNELSIDSIVTPISTSYRLMKYLEDNGFEIIYTPVGAKHIVKEMITNGCQYGFEENGGLVYYPHIPGRDGLLTFLLTLSIISKTGRMMKNLIKELPSTHTVKRKVRIKGDKLRIMEEIRADILNKMSANTCTTLSIDGVKIICEDYSILVRPSGTEPLIRIFVEHDDPIIAEKLAIEIIDKILEIDKRLTYL